MPPNALVFKGAHIDVISKIELKPFKLKRR
jgi:hypothetical protein